MALYRSSCTAMSASIFTRTTFRRHVERGDHIAGNRAFRSNGIITNDLNKFSFRQKTVASRRCLFQSGYCKGTYSTQIDCGIQPRRHLERVLKADHILGENSAIYGQ